MYMDWYRELRVSYRKSQCYKKTLKLVMINHNGKFHIHILESMKNKIKNEYVQLENVLAHIFVVNYINDLQCKG